jgi:hypothetical protein
MQKYHLIVASVCSTIFLILCSFTNVMGIQMIQPSTQRITKEENNQKELLFKTILDIANNMEIQKLVFNSKMKTETIFTLNTRHPDFIIYVFTKNFLITANHLGLILSKTLRPSRIHLLLSQYHTYDSDLQKKINILKTKNDALNRECIQLSSFNCDCQNEPEATKWTFPVICVILLNLFIISALLYLQSLVEAILNLAITIQCSWAP